MTQGLVAEGLRQGDTLWRVRDLAQFLGLNEGTVYAWLGNKITEADGWVSLSSRQSRFLPQVVKARLAKNWFARGLDVDGNPQPVLRVVKKREPK